jgi:hypothetical protein
MHADAGDSPAVEVEGTLRWNDFEGGFWSLDLDHEHEELGERVVLSGFELPPDAEDGSRVRMRVRARPDLVDFLMAGLRVEVESAELVG